MSSTKPNNKVNKEYFSKIKNTFHVLLFKICRNEVSLFSEITYTQDKRKHGINKETTYPLIESPIVCSF